MDNLFLNLFKLQSYDGESFHVQFTEDFISRNYFLCPEECYFYTKGLLDAGLIKGAGPTIEGIFTSLTHFGLNKTVELLKEGNDSNKCFIAMSFNPELNVYRDAIKRALIHTKFEAIIIDETNLRSDQTIPDGILAGIKKSKFCIADFTEHKKGVYFESGYALGLGKSVIYVCKREEFEKTHFDIKQLQHIIYEDAEDLQKRLIDKIEAWIM